MEKPKVFVTRKIPGKGIEMLEKECAVKVSPFDRVLTKEELIKNVPGLDGLLSLLTDKIDQAIIEAAGPNLKVIANYAVGFDNIDLKSATEKGIAVTNTPEVLTETVAEHAFTLMLAIARRIVEADSFTRKGLYQGWAPELFLGTDVFGKTLGIVGLGRIGKAVSQRAVKGFGMQALYFDVKRDLEFEKEFSAKFAALPEILQNADFVSLHVPLLPSTTHLISEKELKIMKKTAYLINTSRGPIVDEKALVEALKNKTIAGAALDVFEKEPALSPGLADLANVIITPHIASATTETRAKMGELAAANLLAVLSGKTPPNLLNPDYKK